MHRRQPLGLAPESPPADGIAPWAAARTSGPTSTVTGGTEPVAARPRPSSALSGSDIGSAPFEVEDQVYRLRRTDTRWQRAANEVSVAPAEAVAILERAIGDDRPVRLASLLEAAIARLAGLHEDGIYVLLRLRPEGRRERVAPSAPPPPPRLPAAAVVVRSERPPIEEPNIPVAQARALKNAAALGVPFCEECARAAAQHASPT